MLEPEKTEPLPGAPELGRPAAPQKGQAETNRDGPEPQAPRAATLTGVLDVGAVAGRGSVLYAADTEPVVALLAPEALFRDLETASTDGDDIKSLEENLSALGYGRGVTVDRHFDAATAAAVRRWELAIGREAPDGVVSVGEVVFLPEPAAVISRRAAVGDKLNLGTAVLTLGTQSRVVTAEVDVSDRGSWSQNTSVQLDWTDRPGTGTVTEVGRDEVDGQIEITITLGPDTPEVPIGTEVEISTITAEREGVVTVPVSAVVQGRGGPAVRTGGGSELPVKLGMVSGGLVEVIEGLKEGTKVQLPG